MNVLLEYAVKVVCGRSDGRVVAPGEYWTAVNVHNPNAFAVKFRKKVATALPRERPGPVSDFFDAKLGPDEALEIDRADIFEHAGQQEFLKGFVVIQSREQLDVVAVYTAGEPAVRSIHTERVWPRRMRVGQPDLVPVPDEHGRFCRRDDEGNLIVTVRNQGDAPAGPSRTEVDFFSHGSSTQATPALGAGQSVELRFPIPIRCHDPDCEFRITVDVGNDVTESLEINNVATDTCFG